MGEILGPPSFEPLKFSPPLQKSLGPMILPKRCFFLVPHQKSPRFLGVETVSAEDQHTFQGFNKNPWSTGACVVWNDNFWNPFPVAWTPSKNASAGLDIWTSRGNCLLRRSSFFFKKTCEKNTRIGSVAWQLVGWRCPTKVVNKKFSSNAAALAGLPNPGWKLVGIQVF